MELIRNQIKTKNCKISEIIDTEIPKYKEIEDHKEAKKWKRDV